MPGQQGLIIAARVRVGGQVLALDDFVAVVEAAERMRDLGKLRMLRVGKLRTLTPHDEVPPAIDGVALGRNS